MWSVHIEYIVIEGPAFDHYFISSICVISSILRGGKAFCVSFHQRLSLYYRSIIGLNEVGTTLSRRDQAFVYGEISVDA